jgi:hypothetical protein
MTVVQVFAQLAVVPVFGAYRTGFPNIIYQMEQRPFRVLGHFPKRLFQFFGHTDNVFHMVKVIYFLLLVKKRAINELPPDFQDYALDQIDKLLILKKSQIVKND